MEKKFLLGFLIVYTRVAQRIHLTHFITIVSYSPKVVIILSHKENKGNQILKWAKENGKYKGPKGLVFTKTLASYLKNAAQAFELAVRLLFGGEIFSAITTAMTSKPEEDHGRLDVEKASNLELVLDFSYVELFRTNHRDKITHPQLLLMAEGDEENRKWKNVDLLIAPSNMVSHGVLNKVNARKRGFREEIRGKVRFT